MAFPSEKGYAHSYLQLTTHSPGAGVFIFGNLWVFLYSPLQHIVALSV